MIFDNHLHLRREGRFLEAVKDFKREGGTHFILCQYPMVSRVIKERSYKGCYIETLKMAKEICSKINVKVFVTLGPHPADYLKLRRRFNRKEAIEIMKKGIDEAARHCLEGDCIAIGEIGRPHFPVDKEALGDSNEILRYGMKVAKEVGVPVVVHTESTSPKECKELASLGIKVGLHCDKIVKHYSPPLIRRNENFGIMPSILAKRENIVEALKKGSRFLLETDYIDDPKRPGAVLSPKTVPRITKLLLKEGILIEEQAYKIHVENPEKTYGISFE
jgi:TatD-related deoxyribonuclease